MFGDEKEIEEELKDEDKLEVNYSEHPDSSKNFKDLNDDSLN
jgi:hypothetical protein